MKSAVETLNPTRVKLTVEVPFAELKPSVDEAYRTIGGSIAIPGFRKGKVPPRLIDQRVGRAAVLEEAVNGALPRFYSEAVESNDVAVIGQPEVEVTEFADGEQLIFTAEVDVRPEVVLPDYSAIEVTVDAVTVDESDVDEQVQTLRERFGVLKGVDRPAAEGDFLSLDLSAMVGEEEVDATSGVSYEVGSAQMLDGLDDAVRGLGAGESASFDTELAGGAHQGETATVTVTVKSVKERELPDLDDEFAQTASEFDALDELRADIRGRVERMKKLEQGVQARDKVLAALLEKVAVPLPEGIVASEVEGRMHNLGHQLEQAGLTKEAYLAEEGQSEEEFDAEVAETARDAIASQFVLDAIVEKEQLQVTQEELTEHLVRRAQRSGMAPEEFADQIVKSGQVQLLVGEVVRGKALAVVLSGAKVIDTEGNPVDLDALRDDAPGSGAAGDETAVEDSVGDDSSSDDGSSDDSAAGVSATDDSAAGDSATDDSAAGDEDEQQSAQA